MADNWDLSAVVNSTSTPPSITFHNTFPQNVNSENPLEFLNHLTFGDDDGLHFSELEPPKISCSQFVEDSFFDPFLVHACTDFDALQTGGENTLEPTPSVSIHGFQEVPRQDPFLFHFQHSQLQQQTYNQTHPNFSAMGSPNSFICESFQQFGQGERPFLRPPLPFELQAAPPIPIPRLPTQRIACPRSRNRRCIQKRKVEKVPADKLNSIDTWSWRKYGQKSIKGSSYPRNYYRCSSAKGCTARKQVEKSNTDPDVFIVCYAGDHNHIRPRSNRSYACRYRYLARTDMNIPLNQDHAASSVAPPTTEQGSSYLSPILPATSLSQTTPPLSVSKDHVDKGANTEGHVDTSNGYGKGDGNNMLIPKLDEAKI